jgi:RNA polymerase sigma-70 factor (ECF subfamily)
MSIFLSLIVPWSFGCQAMQGACCAGRRLGTKTRSGGERGPDQKKRLAAGKLREGEVAVQITSVSSAQRFRIERPANMLAPYYLSALQPQKRTRLAVIFQDSRRTLEFRPPDDHHEHEATPGHRCPRDSRGLQKGNKTGVLAVGGLDDSGRSSSDRSDPGAPLDDFAAIIAAARGGCPKSFDLLFADCFEYLRAAAAADLPAELNAKVSPRDLAQDSLIEAQAKLATFHGSSKEELRAWLRGFLANNVSKTARHFFGTQMRDAAREVRIEYDSHAEHDGLVDQGILTPSAQFAADEEEQRIAAALAQLSNEHRQTILLRNTGLSFAEIGAKCDRTEEAVRKLWTRGLVRLRELLSNQGTPGGAGGE